MDEPPSYTIILAVTTELTNVLGFAAVVLFLLMSALASASEIAFFSFTADALKKFKPSSDIREALILKLLDDPKLLLTTILIIDTFAKIGVVIISISVLWNITAFDLDVFTLSLVTFSVIFAITFFGEIFPRVYAAKKNIVIARQVCRLWKGLTILCWPLSTLLIKLSGVVEKLFEKRNFQTSAEELNQALELAVDSEHTTEDEKEILRGIVNFGSLTINQVMRSRLDISAVTIDLSFSDLITSAKKSGYSRIPVLRNNIDEVVGVLYIKDLLPFLNQPENFEWQKLLRPGFFVLESKKVDSLLKDFQEKRVHMALVVDEYGGTAGLITLEDIIEEIIGDINDEFDDVALLSKN